MTAVNVRPSARVTASLHERGVVFLDSESGRLFTSNEIGARIWAGMARGLALDAIAEGLARDFKVRPEMVRAHAAKFLAELEEQRLITRSADR